MATKFLRFCFQGKGLLRHDLQGAQWRDRDRHALLDPLHGVQNNQGTDAGTPDLRGHAHRRLGLGQHRDGERGHKVFGGGLEPRRRRRGLLRPASGQSREWDFDATSVDAGDVIATRCRRDVTSFRRQN